MNMRPALPMFNTPQLAMSNAELLADAAAHINPAIGIRPKNLANLSHHFFIQFGVRDGCSKSFSSMKNLVMLIGCVIRPSQIHKSIIGGLPVHMTGFRAFTRRAYECHEDEAVNWDFASVAIIRKMNKEVVLLRTASKCLQLMPIICEAFSLPWPPRRVAPTALTPYRAVVSYPITRPFRNLGVVWHTPFYHGETNHA